MQKLEVMLLRALETHATEHRVRLVVCQWINAVFPFDHPKSKLLSLVCRSDQNIEVREEAKKALQPPLSSENKQLVPYPSFKDIVNTLSSPAAKSLLTDVGLSEGLQFVHSCVEYHAREGGSVESFLEGSLGEEHLEQWISLLEECCVRNDASHHLLHKALLFTLELIISIPALSERFTELCDAPGSWLLRHVFESTSPDVRSAAAQLLGGAAAHMDQSRASRVASSLMASIPAHLDAKNDNALANKAHGSLLALGSILSFKVLGEESTREVIRALNELLPHDTTPGSDPSALMRWECAARALGMAGELRVLTDSLELGERVDEGAEPADKKLKQESDVQESSLTPLTRHALHNALIMFVHRTHIAHAKHAEIGKQSIVTLA